ncbi:hypothetical protein OG21DRAFT_1482329 [Imleria badia]|nr:hypothetical protein OG21DRAFT_1482329 [Imleria badia]
MELELPQAFDHYRLSDKSSLDIRVAVESVYPTNRISLLDWKFAQSRKRPRNISRGKFLAEENAMWRSFQRHARACKDWQLRRLDEKAAQLSLVRKQRIKGIKVELEELGWTDIVSLMLCDEGLLRLPQVRKLEALTPSAEWAKIRPEVISWARTVRHDTVWKRCKNMFTSISLSALQELRSDTLMVQPRLIDIAMSPAVRSVLEGRTISYMSDDDDDDLKKKLFHVLPPAIRKWSSDAVEELEQFAREELNLPRSSKPSRLPSVIFRCQVCFPNFRRHQRFSFEEALSHHHLHKAKSEDDDREHIGEMSFYDKYVMGCRTYPRNIQALRVDVPASRRVDNLVRRMGQNPSRVTHDELRHSTVKAVCGLCRPQVATRMNFEQAFNHCVNTHLANKETEVWTRASARE